MISPGWGFRGRISVLRASDCFARAGAPFFDLRCVANHEMSLARGGGATHEVERAPVIGAFRHVVIFPPDALEAEYSDRYAVGGADGGDGFCA